MRMNISVPDDLAEAVRELHLPISAICQNALREAVEKFMADTAAGNDASQDEELARIVTDTGNAELMRLARDQNRMAAGINRLLANSKRQADKVAELQELIEQMERRRQEG
jgi:post-segregation antitoxin (ccd killing protein)